MGPLAGPALTLRRAAACLLGAVLLAGCGAAGTPAASPSPRPTPVVAMTQADGGRTVQLHVGQVASLRLDGGFAWSDPRAAGGAVRVAPAGPHAWTITAVAPGTARLASTGRPVCSPGQLCSDLAAAFSLTVVVT